jgi:hypothetical protein
MRFVHSRSVHPAKLSAERRFELGIVIAALRDRSLRNSTDWPNEGLAPIMRRSRFTLSTGMPMTACSASKNLMHKGFTKAGHLPALFASFLCFDLSFLVAACV